MPHVFFGASVGSDLYVHALSNAYIPGRRLYDPGYALRTETEIYDKIRRDPTIHHALTLRKHLIAGTAWNISPPEATDENKKAAAIMEQLINQIERFDAGRFNLGEAVLRGSAYAYIEGERIQMQVQGDTEPRMWWIPKRLRDVDRRRFRQIVLGADRKDASNEGKVIWQLWSVRRFTWENLEHPEYFVKHIYDDVEGSLNYGRGLLDAIYYYWYAKTVVLEKGLQGLERWAMGILKASVDDLRQALAPDTAKQIAQTWLDALTNMRTHNVIVHGKQDNVEVVTGGAEGWQMVKEMLEYLDTGMTTLILASNLPTSASGGGSFALADIQENSRTGLIKYDINSMDESLTRDLIGLTWRLNRNNFVQMGLSNAKKPIFTSTLEKKNDPTQSMQVIGQALQAGISLKKQEVYERIGYSIPDANDEVITGLPSIPVGEGAPQLEFPEFSDSHVNGNGKLISTRG